MKRSLLILTIISAPVFASPPCDESKGYYEAFDLFTLSNQCFAMNIWDFTLSDKSSGIDHASYGSSGTGGSAGAGVGGAGSGSGAGGAGNSGGVGAAGSDGGNSGGNAGDSGPAGCDA